MGYFTIILRSNTEIFQAEIDTINVSIKKYNQSEINGKSSFKVVENNATLPANNLL